MTDCKVVIIRVIRAHFFDVLDIESRRLRRYGLIPMRMPGFSILAALVAASSVHAESAADQLVRDAIKAPDLTVVHLWAPWCSNCQAELKNGGWLKVVKENPKTKFIFVSVWNNGNDGRSMLERFGLTNQPNLTIAADPGPRSGEGKIKQ